jgi:mRNA-degrading endonuclease RelE of RelBE toxin-antitoxin system
VTNNLNIYYSKNAVKVIKNLDKTIKEKMRIKIEGLIKYPPEGDIKILKGYSDERMRLRVGIE